MILNNKIQSLDQQFILKIKNTKMSRYQEFQQQNSDNQSFINEQETIEPMICVKNLLSKPNPLMDKIQYQPYDAKNHYPVLLTKLPAILNQHQYYVDRNNMLLIDESIFAHEKMKKDFAKCLMNTKKPNYQYQLQTLKQFYQIKHPIFQRFPNMPKSNYFATYVLNMSTMSKSSSKIGQNNYIIRNSKTPPITQRSLTTRVHSLCRSQIQFNSNFQSGNLFKVYQIQYNEFDLILQNDINTKGNNQWFFFNVRNVPKGTTLRLNIVNMTKSYSLFQYGMKPSVFSMMKYEKRKIGWVRDGTKISYKQSTQHKKQSNSLPYYTLSFQYKFTYQGDIVYFSYSIPYTFSNLCSFMSGVLSNRDHSKNIRVKSIGETVGGNQVNLFQFTNSESYNPNKKSIWIMARQHSGEVTSSFMVQGIINFLLSDKEEATFLLNNFILKIVPMVNIDGVTHGNTRAQLTGCDSNRKWYQPHKIYQPIVYNIKKMIEKDNVEMILDLHSHSRKLGTFFYTNSSLQYSNTIKIFPMMVCMNDHRFDFRMNRYKGGNDQTARKVFFDILNIPYIYTIESSFYGYQKEGDFKIISYQPNDYRQMGETVLKTFAQMMKKKKKYQNKDVRLLICNQEQLKEEGNLWQKMNQADEIESVGSDENPAQDEFSKKQLEFVFDRPTKKNIKKKKKRIVSKISLPKKQEPKKIEPETPARFNDKQSYYKKHFSGRCSMNSKQTDFIFEIVKKPRVQVKNYSCQVDLTQKVILHKSSLNNVQTERLSSRQKFFQKKSLCIVGQKVEDDLTIALNSVGLQVDMDRNFLKNRNEMVMETQKATKRLFKSNNKLTTIMLNNQNNFLNKGQILHTALRMLNKR